MMSPTTVELTRVHFFDPLRSERNAEIPSISREVFRYDLRRSPIIKKNIFGHRWVLKIGEEVTEEGEEKKSGWIDGKVIVYVWVFCCIVVAVGFGVYFSIESRYFPSKNNNHPRNSVETESSNRTTGITVELPNVELVEEDSLNSQRKFLLIERTPQQKSSKSTPTTSPPQIIPFCDDCIFAEEICLKTEDFHSPICVKIRDRRDPTGCGGLCELNTQHCKRLHPTIEVFQCVKNENILHCPAEKFSCGNMCIPRYHRCDGVIHCSNMVDENNCECDMNSYFHCGNRTSCIEIPRKCNGIIDCWDKSDETDCHRNCDTDQEPCSNGQCIKKEQFCDGKYDCDDRSDEPQGC